MHRRLKYPKRISSDLVYEKETVAFRFGSRSCLRRECRGACGHQRRGSISQSTRRVCAATARRGRAGPGSLPRTRTGRGPTRSAYRVCASSPAGGLCPGSAARRGGPARAGLRRVLWLRWARLSPWMARSDWLGPLFRLGSLPVMNCPHRRARGGTGFDSLAAPTSAAILSLFEPL
jgi:hypothetical protein